MTKTKNSLDAVRKLRTINILDVTYTKERLTVSYNASKIHTGEKWNYLVLIILLSCLCVALIADKKTDVALFPGALSLIFTALFFLNFSKSNKTENLEITDDSLIFSTKFNAYNPKKLSLESISSIYHYKESKTISLFSNQTYFEVVIEAIDQADQKHIILGMASKNSDIDRQTKKICVLLMNYINGTRKKRNP